VNTRTPENVAPVLAQQYSPMPPWVSAASSTSCTGRLSIQIAILAPTAATITS